ncbi:TIGR03086 family metal-binding protein [Microbispora corallina]|uniref:TIGR03086 family protein n=1 Tax=Microbispora corallina TaxID=83302 RepID=A0ABQ4G6H6_9ACTN|nr:TIGR03086 family metal-binding protein [Microbispora corallina]GIH42622.1 TIGR03086 family protein [Microbispora corallina]
MVPDGFVRALDAFEAVLAATPSDRWESPSPCEGWCAIDVAGHVIAGLWVIEARAAGRPLPEADPDWREAAGEDPVATWRAARARVTALLGPEALARRIQLALGLEITLSEWLERYPLELLVHTWDLAQATGQVVVLEPDLVRAALETAKEFAPQGREAGMLGPERAVADDADDQTRLLAVFGRGVG